MVDLAAVAGFAIYALSCSVVEILKQDGLKKRLRKLIHKLYAHISKFVGCFNFKVSKKYSSRLL